LVVEVSLSVLLPITKLKSQEAPPRLEREPKQKKEAEPQETNLQHPKKAEAQDSLQTILTEPGESEEPTGQFPQHPSTLG